MKMVLSLEDPNDGMKLPIITHIKTMRLSFTSLSVLNNTEVLSEVLRFNDIFIATDNSVREVALRLKNLHGNQNLL